jgi:hypothetical protein
MQRGAVITVRHGLTVDDHGGLIQVVAKMGGETVEAKHGAFEGTQDAR